MQKTFDAVKAHMEQACRLGMAEDIIDGMDMTETADDIMESGEGFEIVVSGLRVHVPELGIDLHKGIYCSYDREAGGFFPDFAVTVIKKEGEREWLCYMQGGFVETLAEFLAGEADLDRLAQMRCMICMPDYGTAVRE